jgi:chorismate synthase
MLRYLTAGESHGKGLTAILEGIPAGLILNEEDINRDLARRQVGYGRGARMKIERDKAEILSGVRGGETLGSPIALFIKNQDWANWEEIMSSGPDVQGVTREVTRPRPGHADLPGGIKYRHRDLRNILERSSARETAARVAVGAIARKLLNEFGIQMASHVVEIGGIGIESSHILTTNKIRRLSDKSDLRCVDSEAAKKMKSRIDKAAKEGDSLGGIFEVKASGVPVGLGSHVQYDRKLNSRLAGAIMSIQAIKGVEIGSGFESARRPGSDVHDEIFYSKARGFSSSPTRSMMPEPIRMG